jgi:hypothetical protein
MKEGTSKRETFFVLAWMIWGYRNNAWLKQSHLAASRMGAKIVSYVEEILEANQRVESVRPISENKWLPPPTSCVKMNVVWKRFMTKKSFGVGLVSCDSLGVLLQHIAKFFLMMEMVYIWLLFP